MQAILQYQEYDRQLRQLRHKLNSNSDYQEYTEATKWLKEGVESREKYEREVKEINVKLTRLSATTKQQQKEIEDHFEEIDKCEDLKEVDYLSRKITELQKSVALLERENRSLTSQLEEIAAKYDVYRSRLLKVKQKAIDAKAKFEIIAKQKEPEIIELRNKMAELKKSIPANIMEQYEVAKSQKIFPLFVELRDGNRCGGCGMEMSMAHKQEFATKSSIRCESCRRIIFKPEE